MPTNLRFQYMDAVWSLSPIFFHGTVVGWYASPKQGFRWVVETLGGNILFVEDSNLTKAKTNPKFATYKLPDQRG